MIRIKNKRKLTEDAQEKIDELVNDIIHSIDIDLLSNSEKIIYLKTIIGHSIPKKESLRLEGSGIPNAIKWIVGQTDNKIDNLVNERIERSIKN